MSAAVPCLDDSPPVCLWWGCSGDRYAIDGRRFPKELIVSISPQGSQRVRPNPPEHKRERRSDFLRGAHLVSLCAEPQQAARRSKTIQMKLCQKLHNDLGQ